QGEFADLPRRGEHGGPRTVAFAAAARHDWIAHHGVAGALPPRNPDDVARAELFQCRNSRGPPLCGAFAGQRGLAVLDRVPKPPVFLEVAQVTGHGLAVAVEAFLVAAQLPR